MNGLMMDILLFIVFILCYVEKVYSDGKIISCKLEGGVFWYIYVDVVWRVCKIVNVLSCLGVQQQDCVVILVWNIY